MPVWPGFSRIQCAKIQSFNNLKAGSRVPERPRGVSRRFLMRKLTSFAGCAAVAGFLAVLLLGCSSGSMSGQVANGHGTVSVFLTDAPIDLANVKSVNVTLTSVVLYPTDDGGSD